MNYLRREIVDRLYSVLKNRSYFLQTDKGNIKIELDSRSPYAPFTERFLNNYFDYSFSQQVYRSYSDKYLSEREIQMDQSMRDQTSEDPKSQAFLEDVRFSFDIPEDLRKDLKLDISYALPIKEQQKVNFSVYLERTYEFDNQTQQRKEHVSINLLFLSQIYNTMRAKERDTKMGHMQQYNDFQKWPKIENVNFQKEVEQYSVGEIRNVAGIDALRNISFQEEGEKIYVKGCIAEKYRQWVQLLGLAMLILAGTQSQYWALRPKTVPFTAINSKYEKEVFDNFQKEKQQERNQIKAQNEQQKSK